MRKGLLLLNLGSPDSPTPKALRRYLGEFLWDWRVVDIPPVFRWLLLHGIILRFRPRKSAHAYSRIWTPEGSPLIRHARDLTDKVARRLGQDWRVDFAMRYGNPSIPDRLREMLSEPLRELVVLPLYPQYASASTGSSVEALWRALARMQNIPPTRVLGPFFFHPAFLRAAAEPGLRTLEMLKPDHVLFTYHGLPERQVRKAETAPGHCLAEGYACCAEYGPRNAFCYRAQCLETTRLLAGRLGLQPGTYSTSFQSRIGRTPWIGPHTEQALVDLARRGARRLAVATPSFAADCLETLEEIGMRGAETFRAAGGEILELVPAPNASDAFADAVAEMASAP